MLVFTTIAFSPWSEKARWALDHHGVAYREVDYTPILGEYVLRWKMRKPFGRVTVPALFDGARWHTDSYAIARHADTIGRASPLFPAGRDEEIALWNARSERALAAGRAILMQRFAGAPELALAALPSGFVSRVLRRAPGRSAESTLRRMMIALGRERLASFNAKYGIRAGDDGHYAILVEELDRLMRVLDDAKRTASPAASGTDTSEGPYLVGGAFSYADIAMALTLQQVRPVDPRWIIRMEGLSPAGMDVPDLIARHAPLFAWRDALYARWRAAGRTSECTSERASERAAERGTGIPPG